MGAMLYFIRGFLIVAIVSACADHLRQSLNETNKKKFCSSVSKFTNCMVSTHNAMGSPFGANLTNFIGPAIYKSVQQVCAIRCSTTVNGNLDTKPPKNLLKAGNKLKLCAFDFILSNKFDKKRSCEHLQEAVKCFILASTKKSYLLRTDELQAGTYVLAEILRMSFQINCPDDLVKERLIQTCRGRYSIKN
ncbi:hypothetical protein BgiMline_020782 [Biomphalaria glabrata]|nr:hypothetical protein BgiMline_017965 [Biomphalaria glabrata]